MEKELRAAVTKIVKSTDAIRHPGPGTGYVIAPLGEVVLWRRYSRTIGQDGLLQTILSVKICMICIKYLLIWKFLLILQQQKFQLN